MKKYTEDDLREDLKTKEYEAGFYTDIEYEDFPTGLSEDIIRAISAKKEEPEWMTEWRLESFRIWQKMTEPDWANVRYEKPDFQAIKYYAAPKKKPELASLDEVDPELLKTFEKLGINIEEQKRLSGVAVDIVMDSVSVKTTFQETLKEKGIIFMSISEAIKEHPDLVRKYIGKVVPRGDNFYAALNSAVFSDGSFAYIPKGVKCPMELSTYFRINQAGTGQFERTLVIADEGAFVSYLEGCTAPARDENQLHAAVVELIALDNAEIKYSTVQNWFPGDEEGKGGVYNFVTKRGLCEKNAKISWTQVETGSAVTWKYPSCILKGDNSIGEFYSIAVTNNHQWADTGTKMIHIGKKHEIYDYLEGNFGRKIQQFLPRFGESNAFRKGRAQFFAVRFPVNGQRMRRAHFSLYRNQGSFRTAGTRGNDLKNRRRPNLLLQPKGNRHRTSHRSDCQWIQ